MFLFIFNVNINIVHAFFGLDAIGGAITAAAEIASAEMNSKATRYAADRELEGTRISASAQRYEADRNLDGIKLQTKSDMYISDNDLKSDIYLADRDMWSRIADGGLNLASTAWQEYNETKRHKMDHDARMQESAYTYQRDMTQIDNNHIENMGKINNEYQQIENNYDIKMRQIQNIPYRNDYNKYTVNSYIYNPYQN